MSRARPRWSAIVWALALLATITPGAAHGAPLGEAPPLGSISSDWFSPPPMTAFDSCSSSGELGIEGPLSLLGLRHDLAPCASETTGAETAKGTRLSASADETNGSCEPAPDDDWCEEWVATYDGDTPAPNLGVTDSVLSPAGDQLFVLGNNWERDEDGNITQEITIITGAFDAATGEKIWVAKHPAGTPGYLPGGIAVSPDGSSVFIVATERHGPASEADRETVTIAYNAAPPKLPADPELGEQLWIAKFGPASNGGDGIVVTPDGATVLVVGDGTEGVSTPADGSDYVTIAYKATTGEQLWFSRYGLPRLYDDAHAIALSPNGELAYVTGYVQKGIAPVGWVKTNAVTIAYVVSGDSRGEVRWVAEYGLGTSSQGWDVSVSEDGHRVFVTGFNTFEYTTNYMQILTVGYDAATGNQLWSAQYGLHQGGFGRNLPAWYPHESVAVSPNNDLVFVTGTGANRLGDGGCGIDCDIVVLAYDQTTGAERWSRTYSPGNGREWGNSVASSPDGTRVYVTGLSNGHVNLAYDTATGEQVAVAHLNVFTDFDDGWGVQVLPSADGSRVYTVGDISPGNRDVWMWGISAHPTPGSSE